MFSSKWCSSCISRTAFFVLILFLSIGCATSKFDEAVFDEAYRNNDYGLCIKMLKAKNYGKENAVLKNVDLGVLAHYAKDYKVSSEYFNKGDRLIEAGQRQGICQFESFYLNILNSLNYYHMGQLDDSAVEIKKADDEKIRAGRENPHAAWFILDNSADIALIRGYDSDEQDSRQLENAYETFGIRPAETNTGLPRKPTQNDLYKGSATAYYLGSLIRTAQKDFEGARLDKDYLKILNPDPALANSLKRKPGAAHLNILAFSGCIAQKKEEVFYFPPEKNNEPQFLSGISIPINGIPLNLPKIRFKFSYAAASENVTSITDISAVIINTVTQQTQKCDFAILEDFGEDLKKNVALKARKEFQYNRAASIIGKLTAAISSGTTIFAARQALSFVDNPIAQIFAETTLSIAEAALPTALEQSDNAINADIRQAKFFPAKSSAMGISLPEGIYDIKVCYLNNGITVFEDSFSNVNIKEGKLNLLESICLK